MKVETFSFTPSNSSETILLNDGTLNVDFIFFQVSKNGSNVNEGTGFSDGTTQRAKYTLDDSVKSSGRTTSYCVYNKKNSSGTAVVANAGKTSAGWNSTAGQFTINFDNYDSSYTLDGYVLGH